MSERLIHGHALFRARYFDDPSHFQTLAKSQSPNALFIGCSDSRVIPELVTNAQAGELFVLRNIANFVPEQPHSDASVGAAIEYAVRHLRVPDIVVCGHYRCGGVKAALDDLRGLERDTELCAWLQGVLPAAERARARVTGDTDALWNTAVEENVLDALENLITFDAVRERLDEGKLHLHGWIYDLAAGRVLVYDAENDAFVDPLAAGA